MSKRVVALAELAAEPGEPRERGRADVGAVGEAEEDRERLAREPGARKRLAVGADERERPADRRQRQARSRRGAGSGGSGG